MIESIPLRTVSDLSEQSKNAVDSCVFLNDAPLEKSDQSERTSARSSDFPTFPTRILKGLSGFYDKDQMLLDFPTFPTSLNKASNKVRALWLGGFVPEVSCRLAMLGKVLGTSSRPSERLGPLFFCVLVVGGIWFKRLIGIIFYAISLFSNAGAQKATPLGFASFFLMTHPAVRLSRPAVSGER